MTEPEGWVILCRAPHVGRDDLCVWWRPGGNGYTNSLTEAGRWTEEEATRRAGARDLAVHVATAEKAAFSVVRRGALGVPGETETRV
jgi:hypothetical protein